jgi:cation diffusion facilitator CzcD-associated flavoprotein CzcO
VAIVGAGPSGLVAAKHALEAGFDVAVFEASDDLGGQWYTTAAHSGVWPGMHTNTSRAMTAFSDFAAPADHPLHPVAQQIHAYLRAYAEHFGVTGRIRPHTPVRRVSPAWAVDGERFDGVIVASGRFRKPRLPTGLDAFDGDVIHAFEYPGAEPYRDRRTLVYGNGISGLEIASDLAAVTAVVSAFRKPRYVIQKVVGGVSSDWQWYTAFGALERRLLPHEALSRTLRDRVLRVAGNPAAFGAPEPHGDIFTAGLSLCQDYLTQVADGSIVCRPAIAAIDGRVVTFIDGSIETVDAIVCATGYDVEIPYLDDRRVGGARPRPRPLPAHAASGSPRLRRRRPVPRPGPLPPTARAAGALDRRNVGGRRLTARRGAHARHDRRAPTSARPAQRTGDDARRRARRRAGPAQPPRAHRGTAVRGPSSPRATGSTARAHRRTPPSDSARSSPLHRGHSSSRPTSRP